MPNIAIGISPTSGAYTAKVPVNSLAESGVPPEEGDKVQFSVEGTVQSVSGSNATLSIDSVNGEPVSEEASETPEDEEQEGQQGAAPGAGGGPSGPQSGASPGPGMGLGAAPGLGGGLARPKKTAIPGLAALGNKLRRGARGPGAMQF